MKSPTKRMRSVKMKTAQVLWGLLNRSTGQIQWAGKLRPRNGETYWHDFYGNVLTETFSCKLTRVSVREIVAGKGRKK